MTSVYTELTKEAAKRGGPAALRAFYRNLGRGQGAIVGGAIVGVSALLYNKVNARRGSSCDATAPEMEREVGPDSSAPTKGGDAERLEDRGDSPRVATTPGILDQ
ncbi:hypothetical protein ACFWBM_18350 [Streptomyces sp. NPDC059980]|uniref:hypothetical protein n=1 Tax=Streptomyces sp. NPDC059980 TaxID=3347022 RepID=UPI0036A059E4